MERTTDIRCPHVKNAMIAHLKNNVLDVARKGVLLLNLAPGILFARNKLEDPKKIDPNVKGTVVDTRVEYQEALVEPLGGEEGSLRIEPSDDFVEFIASTLGESRVDYNPVRGFLQTGSGPDGYSGNFRFIDKDNETITESDIPVDRNDLTFSYNLVQAVNGHLVEIDPTTKARTTIINNRTTVDSFEDITGGNDGNYYVGNNSGQLQKFDGASVTTTLHTLTIAEGDVMSVDKGLDGNIYFTAFGIDGRDWNHSVYKYNVETETINKVFDQNLPGKQYKGVIVATDGTMYISSSSVTSHNLERVDSSNTTTVLTSTTPSEISNSSMTGVSGFVDGDGALSSALIFPNHNGGVTKIDKQHIAPTITGSASITVDEDSSGSADLSSLTSDPSHIKSFVSSTNASLGAASISGNTLLTFTPVANAHGTATVTITVTDASGSTSEVTFDVTVNPVDDAPTLTSGVSLDATQGQAFAYTITGSDVDGNDLTYLVSGLPTWLSFDSGNQVTGTPTDAHVGDHTFTVTISDGTTSVDVEVTVNVEAVAVGNNAPIIADMEDVTFNEDEVVSTVVGVNISDVDGDTPTVSVSSSNVNVTAEFNNNNNIIEVGI